MNCPTTHSIKKFNRKPSTKYAPPGEYMSTITAIEPASGYRLGDAFVFKYQLVSTVSGQQFEKTEIILNDANSERLGAILCNLPDAGASLSNIEDLIGLQETVTLENVVVNGKKFTNITSRRYVGFV